MATRFPNGIQDIKPTDFSSFILAQLSDADLGLISQKCLEMILVGSHEADAAKAMLEVIASERNYRAARTTRRAFFGWSFVTVIALILVGLLQAYAIYATSYSADDSDDSGTCEQNQDYSV